MVAHIRYVPPPEVRYMMYVGIDLGVDTCSASIVDEQGEIKDFLEFSNDESGWKELMNAIGKDVDIAMEACTAAYPIHDYLMTRGYSVSVGHPSTIKAITHSKSKTDQKDSEILANLLRLKYLPLAYIPSPEILEIRDLMRARAGTGQEITRVKNKIHGFLTKNGFRSKYKRKSDLFGKSGRELLDNIQMGGHRDCILETMVDHLDNLECQKERLQNEIAKISIKNQQVILLMSIPGIDYYSALIIINEIADVDRFDDHEKLCMYSGLVPSVWRSANVTRMGRITKNGPSLLRWALTMAVSTLIKYKNPIHEFYSRVSNRKKCKKIAHVAAARKLLVMIYYMLKNNEPCRWEIPGLTEKKTKALQRACRKKVLNA